MSALSVVQDVGDTLETLQDSIERSLRQTDKALAIARDALAERDKAQAQRDAVVSALRVALEDLAAQPGSDSEVIANGRKVIREVQP